MASVPFEEYVKRQKAKGLSDQEATKAAEGEAPKSAPRVPTPRARVATNATAGEQVQALSPFAAARKAEDERRAKLKQQQGTPGSTGDNKAAVEGLRSREGAQQGPKKRGKEVYYDPQSNSYKERETLE
jgi:hypothetical protein